MPRRRTRRRPAPRHRAATARRPKAPAAEVDLVPEEFRRLGYATIDLLSDYYGTVRGRRILPDTTPAELRRLFDEPVPKRGRAPARILKRWSSAVVPNAGHLGSPRFFGYVQGSGLQIGTIADALASALNPNVADWRMSPAETEIERRVVRWIAEMIGYPGSAGGTLTSGGMAANHAALQVALHSRSPYDMTADGLQSPRRTGRFVLYMSDHEGHVTIRRCAELLNLGRSAVRPVASRDDFTMDPAALRRAIDEDEARGERPFCVVAQAGSINVGAIDPLGEIADVCARHGLWFHVDGAAGAFGAMLPELRPLFAGLERADSVTVDPHKWLYLSKECGGLLVRDEELLRRTFSSEASYLDRQATEESAGTNFRALGTQSSRGFRALKVWMALQQLGTDGYARLFRQNLACVAHLHARVQADPEFEALHEPRLYIYSFRYRPHRFPSAVIGEADSPSVGAYLDRLNAAIVERANRTGEVFLTTTRLRDRTALRVSVCNHRTTLEDIDHLFELLRRTGEALDAEELRAGAPGRRT